MSGGFVERELAVARGLASCRGDDARLDEADAEIAKLRADNDALRAELREITTAQAWGFSELMVMAALDKYRGQLDRFGVHSAADAIDAARKE